MSAQFTHLHLHSEYSLSNGILTIAELIDTVQKFGQTSVALTDQYNMFAAIKFYKTAVKNNIKPIIGCEMAIFDAGAISRLILLAQNQNGYKNLKSLISRSYLEGQQNGTPMLDKLWLSPENTSDLIALSAGIDGDIGIQIIKNNIQQALVLAKFWQNLFHNRFYLEITRTNKEYETLVIVETVTIAQKLHIPIVASNAVHFLSKDDFNSHETRVCINQGTVLDNPNRDKKFTDSQFLANSQTMCKKFKDLPSAIFNTNEIAKRCTVFLEFGNPQLPDYPIPPTISEKDFFIKVANEGLAKRLKELFPDKTLREKNYPIFQQRLDTELAVISGMGFSGYFLIVMDFIRWAQSQKIPVGPGRGSGAGSLVAYVLKITNIEPIRYDLLFERFLNPERVSMPDFDIDFCMDKRDLVIDYVADKYGKDRVSQIITYGSMNAKGVVRDVARVLGLPYGLADSIAKLIPFDLKMTLSKALNESSELQRRYQNEEAVAEIIDLAKKLEGLKRNVGKHAAGVVISPSDINDFTPIYCEDNGGEIVTQFDKDDVEDIGLVKFDFLGLRTLTVIDWAIDNIRKLDPNNKININQIDLEDINVYKLFQSGKTLAVFQMESQGLQQMLIKLQPTTFEDIIAAVALYRPGPLEMKMDETYIERKHGRQAVEYLHPNLEEILKPTYGVIVYQEQVMQIARVLAGYSLGSSDILRRAMGKKKPEEMAQQREIFEQGAVNKGVKQEIAAEVFDLMETFASYGFNKSHSAGYAYIAYQTAWLKTYYPAQFMAAVLSSDMDNTDRVVHLIAESKDINLSILPPNINDSNYEFTAINNKQIIYGLGAIKGVGEAAINVIVKNRIVDNYYDLYDLCIKIDTGKVNKRAMEALIRSGACDVLISNFQQPFDGRATLLHNLSAALQNAEQEQKNQASGQNDLFATDETETARRNDYIKVAPWNDDDRLFGERNTLGLFLTGHPIKKYAEDLQNITTHKINQIEQEINFICIAGLVVEKLLLESKTGNKRIVLILEDDTGTKEISLYGKKYTEYFEYSEAISKDSVVVVTGCTLKDNYRGGFQLKIDKLYTIDDAKSTYAKHLKLFYKKDNQPSADLLYKTISPFLGGDCPVEIVYQIHNVNVSIWLGKSFKLKITDSLMKQFEQLDWLDEVKIQF